MSQPACTIIAGPNGAGKTTFALTWLPEVTHCRNFVNADPPLSPENEWLAASRLFLQEVYSYIQRRESFAFETTFAGRTYLRLIRDLLADDWQIIRWKPADKVLRETSMDKLMLPLVS